MTIKTQYGEIDTNHPLMNDKTVKSDLDNLVNAAELFFQDEITTYDDDDLGQRIFTAWAKTFDEPMRIAAIQLFLDCPFNIITASDWGNHNYDVDGEGTFMVLTDKEADEEWFEYEKSLIDDIGVRGAFSTEMIDQILEDPELVDVEWFRGYMEDSNYEYANDIQHESDFPQSDYVNRLHEELCQNDLMEEPEWPRYDDSEEHLEQVEKLRQKYEAEAESKIQEYADFMSKDYENPGEWFKDHFGDEEFKDKVDDNELWEVDKIIKWAMDNSMIERSALASYDNVESDQYVELDGKKENLFIYQMD
jgi:hypothetical protein